MRHVTCETRHTTCDTQHTTCNTRHVMCMTHDTCDMRFALEIVWDSMWLQIMLNPTHAHLHHIPPVTCARITLDHETSSSRGGELFPARLAKDRTSIGKPSNTMRFGPFDLKPSPGHAAEAGGWHGPGLKSNGLNLMES